MSLETINQKLKSVEKISFWKFLLCSFVTGLLSVGVVTLANPTYFEQYESPLVQGILLMLIAMSFTAMYLTLFAGCITCGILVTWMLLKSRDNLYVKNGILIGNSLSTNHEFLRQLADGLCPKIIGFVRGYNDPKFEVLENQISQQDKRVETLEENDVRKDKVIERQNQKIFKIEWENKKLRRENIELKKDKSEKIQTIGDKSQSKNNTENTEFRKFKEDL